MSNGFNVVYVVITHSNVVDPDHVAVVDGDGVSTPDVLGVDIGDGDVPVANQYRLWFGRLC